LPSGAVNEGVGRVYISSRLGRFIRITLWIAPRRARIKSHITAAIQDTHAAAAAAAGSTDTHAHTTTHFTTRAYSQATHHSQRQNDLPPDCSPVGGGIQRLGARGRPDRSRSRGSFLPQA
jgi:hypothetical protein